MFGYKKCSVLITSIDILKTKEASSLRLHFLESDAEIDVFFTF